MTPPVDPPVDPPADEDVCGETYDHDTETTYEGDDGYGWMCRRCGAEGWEEPEDG